ncbi:DNA cytosine methyltransferase [Methylobacterium sp. Leaf100]|uniref:DNA cytosine methyltransferase n=1 Tax=Methylobacterium sp. Leaf100 TaxID=1736252 RepID=UPI0006F8A305|nr:DNA cytosine methyltransferase [Methylobacterium sp. Leaf100]KQP26648.1 DNA methyltransferase [Methylobacterium sp. Leaf100]
MSSRPIGIDLFAGAGGMSLGFEQAGFDIRACVEIDPVHCAVHKFNFPDCAVIPRSVAAVTAQEIRAAAGIGDATVDCVFGGPPCQGFSLIGHRVLDDPRNALVQEFVRLVAELGARTFVFENVKGLTLGLHRKVLDEIVSAFDEVGYDVRLPWQVLDAAEHGVPQRRQRLILFGAKRGTPLPVYPASITRPADRVRGTADLPPGPTCKEALDDLPDANAFDVLNASDAVRTAAYRTPSRYAAEMRCLSNDAWHHGYARTWDPAVLTSSWRTEHTAISQARFAATLPGLTEPISRFYKLRPDGLSNTLRAGTDGARGAFTSPRPIHYAHPRCITVREMARLHGFPDWFRLHWTKWHGARQIGNAVPPPLARAVATEVIRALGVVAKRPRKVMTLGAVDLLYMGSSEAARHFGVPAPNGKRDRKSGARKRSQGETEQARLAALAAYHG